MRDNKTTPITTRMPDNVVSKLDTLCNIAGIKRSQFLIACINSEYDKLEDNPKLKEMLEQVRVLNEQMKNFMDGTEEEIPSKAVKSSSKAVKSSKSSKSVKSSSKAVKGSKS